MHSGIYQLKFPSGHFYIGQSMHLIKRWRVHRSTFSNGRMKQNQPKLFNIWRKHGEPEFQPLVFCSMEQMTWLEQHLISANWGNPLFANTNPDATTSRGVKRTHIPWQKGKKFTAEHRRNLSLAKQDVGGVKNNNAKLTEDQIRDIKKSYGKQVKGSGSTALAKQYGVSYRTILYIVNGERYANVT